MNSAVFDALMDSPVLPEILEQAQRAWVKEQKLRQKFYHDITPELKWEFIQGQVIMHSPVLHRHLLATQRLFSALDAHVRVHNLGIVHIEKALCVFPRNDYEPDIAFFGTAKAALTDADTFKFPIPDLIVEVLSPSTEARDRGVNSSTTPSTVSASTGSSTLSPRPSNSIAWKAMPISLSHLSPKAI